jgi:hypothetical protein
LGDNSNVVRKAECPGKTYNAALEKDFEHTSPDSASDFFQSLQGSDAVRIQASPKIATSIARTTDGHIDCFFANFAGLRGGVNPAQTPQSGVEVSVVSKTDGKGFFLPFMGQVQAVKGERRGDSLHFTLPTISKGAAFWFEP